MKVVSAAGGNAHTIALRGDGTVWLSGGNGAGQLGDGTWVKSNIPNSLVALFDVVSVAAGSYHTLAVQADGTVWAWGGNGYGQLGDGTTTNQPTPVQVKDPSDATGFLTGVVAVAAGERHSLALKANATVWAWGSNGNGRLGDGTWDNSLRPVQVRDPSDASGFLTGVKAIAAGSHSIALKTNKTVWTWGNRDYVQIGRIISGPGSTPQNFAGPVAGMTDVKAIAGGWEHTVALKEDGTVWAAGRNLEGQLGDGTTLGSTFPPPEPPRLFVQVVDPTDPTGRLTGVVAIAANDRFTLAVKGNGTAWGWGSNYAGELCDGTSGVGPGKTTPVQMKDPLDATGFLTNAKAVGAGEYHSLVIKNDGTLWGCGWNGSGQLGDGSWTDRTTPAQAAIPGPGLIVISGPAHVTPGEEVTFVVEYENTFDVPLTDAVIAVELPGDFVYASSSRNGIYWTDRHQVFWKLGNVPPGAKGKFAVKLDASWGLPLHSVGSLRAHIGASNLNTNIDVDEYLHSPIEVDLSYDLTDGELEHHFSTTPELRLLFDHLKGNYYCPPLGEWPSPSYAKAHAAQVTLNNGTSYIRISCLDVKSGHPVFLYKASHSVWAERYDGAKFVMFDQNGEYASESDGVSGCAGAWDKEQAIPDPKDPAKQITLPPLCPCLVNCQLQKIDERFDPKRWGTGSSLYDGRSLRCEECTKSAGKDSDSCYACLRAAISRDLDAKPVTAKNDRGRCLAECMSNPALYPCTRDIEVCTTANDLRDAVAIVRCDTENFPGHGRYIRGLPGRLPIKTKCKPLNELCKRLSDYRAACVRLVGCATLKNQSDAQHFPSANGVLQRMVPLKALPLPMECPTGQAFVTRGYEVVVAHDPNAKYVDVTGYVTPGQTVTYTITYENEGAGTAYGVFIVDTLDPNLDASSVSVSNGGTWSPLSRLASWEIGTVPPGGQGAVSFSARVKSDVAADTQIVNSAEVYFPSANEITPTNMVVSVVRGIAADPQTVATVSQVSKAITLTGRDAAGGALTYQITSPPLYGTLSGTPPLVTYASMAEFSGQDEFRFAVSSGTLASDPAKVRINVAPDPADKNPPTVVSTVPADGATGVTVDPSPISTDPVRYIPTITATFSEPMDAATITASTFTVSGGITGTVSYDEVGRTATFMPTKALSIATAYTVALKTGIKDKVGNAMASQYSWQFASQAPVAQYALTVSVLSSSGTGVVTSSPAGIRCGTDCSASYLAGTSVTLMATPSAGSVFDGWSSCAGLEPSVCGGVCVGTGFCKLSMFSTTNVAATFSFVGAGSANANQWVQKSYVAYYGRPADPAGLAYWAGRMDKEGGSLSSIIEAFGRSYEFDHRYGGLTHGQLIDTLYQQTLGRAPDPGGRDWYLGLLSRGDTTPQTITLDLLGGATGLDAQTVANRLDVANHYTGKVAAGCSYGGEQTGVSSLAGVTFDLGTVTAAKTAIENRCAP